VATQRSGDFQRMRFEAWVFVAIPGTRAIAQRRFKPRSPGVLWVARACRAGILVKGSGVGRLRGTPGTRRYGDVRRSDRNRHAAVARKPETEWRVGTNRRPVRLRACSWPQQGRRARQWRHRMRVRSSAGPRRPQPSCRPSCSRRRWRQRAQQPRRQPPLPPSPSSSSRFHSRPTSAWASRPPASMPFLS
jgi:hypothetical protein